MPRSLVGNSSSWLKGHFAKGQRNVQWHDLCAIRNFAVFQLRLLLHCDSHGNTTAITLGLRKRHLFQSMQRNLRAVQDVSRSMNRQDLTSHFQTVTSPFTTFRSHALDESGETGFRRSVEVPGYNLGERCIEFTQGDNLFLGLSPRCQVSCTAAAARHSRGWPLSLQSAYWPNNTA